MVDDDIAGGAGNPLKPAMSSVIDQMYVINVQYSFTPKIS